MRATALSNNLETDLESIADVDKATVNLFGEYPKLEMRAVLTVGDQIDLDGLPDRVDEALERATTTAGVRPEPVQVTLRFKAADPERSPELICCASCLRSGPGSFFATRKNVSGRG